MVTASTGTIDGSVTVSASIDDTVLYASPLTGITWTVKMVTKQPGVVFPYDLATVAPANGITVQQACDNLRLLVINVIDPIKKQYSDMFLTNTIRTRGKGAPTSQHPLGKACDIQYSQASKDDYFTRAQWIRDNIVFDQFLVEYKTTGTNKPWHHLSFNGEANRAQICTFMNDRNCKGPGITGLYDLAIVVGSVYAASISGSGSSSAYGSPGGNDGGSTAGGSIGGGGIGSGSGYQ